MRDGRIDRVIEQGRARTSGIKTRVPELRSRVPELRAEVAKTYKKMDVSWARRGYAKAARLMILNFILGPMIDFYTRTRTVGEHLLEESSKPVIFVVNHSSHLDTPVVLRALPRKWRQRTAVAAAADYFYKKRWKAYFVALLFNTVPIGRNGGGMSEGATDHVDELLDEGWNLLLFPEGTRSRDGSIGKPRSGAAVIAAMHDLDIVPIYVHGTHDAMPPGQNWPKRLPGKGMSRRHKIEVRFGEPIRPQGIDDRKRAMREVRDFWERKGLEVAEDLPVEVDVLVLHEVLRQHEVADRNGDGAHANGNGHGHANGADGDDGANRRERTGRFEPVPPLLAEPANRDRPAPAA